MLKYMCNKLFCIDQKQSFYILFTGGQDFFSLRSYTILSKFIELMFSYKANAICMASMAMPAGAGVAASHNWKRNWKPGQLINCARF